MSAQPTAPSNAFRMTDGQSLYQMERPWQKPSPLGNVGVISQLAVDSRGHVFVLQRTAPRVLVYDREGQLERSFDHPQLPTGHGIFIDHHDQIYLVSYDAHQVLVFDRDFHLRMELGTFNTPTWGAPFSHPTDVAVAPDGDIYVSDGYGNAFVHRFDRQGRHLATWGGVGDGPGQLSTPHGVWVLGDDRVAVCDRDNNRIQVFDRAGRFLEAWGDLLRPMDIWSDGRSIFVTEQSPRLARLDMAGRVQARLRTFGVYPHGVAGDADGNLFIAEQGPTHCVTKYQRVGPA